MDNLNTTHDNSDFLDEVQKQNQILQEIIDKISETESEEKLSEQELIENLFSENEHPTMEQK